MTNRDAKIVELTYRQLVEAIDDGIERIINRLLIAFVLLALVAGFVALKFGGENKLPSIEVTIDTSIQSNEAGAVVSMVCDKETLSKVFVPLNPDETFRDRLTRQQDTLEKQAAELSGQREKVLQTIVKPQKK